MYIIFGHKASLLFKGTGSLIALQGIEQWGTDIFWLMSIVWDYVCYIWTSFCLIPHVQRSVVYWQQYICGMAVNVKELLEPHCFFMPSWNVKSLLRISGTQKIVEPPCPTQKLLVRYLLQRGLNIESVVPSLIHFFINH